MTQGSTAARQCHRKAVTPQKLRHKNYGTRNTSEDNIATRLDEIGLALSRLGFEREG